MIQNELFLSFELILLVMIGLRLAINIQSFRLGLLVAMSLFFAHFLSAQFVPDLLYPHSNEVTKESSITFKWNKDVYQNLNFQFQLSLNPSFSTALQDQTTTNNALQVNGLSNYGQMHYWRVRSSQGPLTSNWSAIDSFYLFVPTSINGLTVWLDPNSGVVLNGANVQTMNDNTSNLNNASQASNTQRPLFVGSDSLINNKSILRFDGLDDFLEIADNPTIDYTDAFSSFVLVKPTVIAVNKTIMAKWDYQTQGSWAWQTEFATANQLMFAPCFNITDPGNQKVFTTNANMQLLQPALLTLVFNGNQVNKARFFKNSGSLNTSTFNSIPTVLPNSTATLKIGKYGGIATRYYQGDIGEILIYNNELSVNDRSLVDNYLRYKYAPPVNLGADTIISANSFCGSIQLKAQYKFQSYVWSNGSTASSIYATVPGTYWVQATDFLGNVSIDTIVVHPPFSVNEPATVGLLCLDDTITWQTSYPSANFLFFWQDGSANNFMDITQAGDYHVKITDLFGCIFYSDTVNFTIDMYAQNAFLGNDTSLCVGNLIALQVGAAETVNYEWNGTSTVAQPSFWVVDTTGNYFVETINVNGCVARDTILITIAGQAPVANFSFQDRCNGIANNFVDLSIPLPSDAIASWSWDLGDGTNSSAQNPNHTYALPGTYDIELYVESAGGCGAFQTAQVTIHTLPTAVIGSAGSCSGQEVQFSNSSTAGSSAISGYFWDFDMPWTGTYNNSTVTVPNRIFDTAGSYDVMMVVTDANSCTDTVYQTVVVNQTPEAAFTAPDVCVSENINFTNTTTDGGAAPTYLWDFGDVTFSVLETPSKSYATYGPRNIILNVTSSNGCSDTAIRIVYVNPNPVIDFSFGPHCFGSYMEMNSASSLPEGSIVSNMWIMNNTDTVYGDPAYFQIDLMGQNEIELTSTSAVGCSTTDLQYFDVVDTLIASFNVGTGLVAVGDPIQFNNTSIGGGIMLWNFDDGTFATDQEPIHTYTGFFTDSIVNPYLIAINAAGCKDTAYQTIQLAVPRIDLELQTIYTQENANSFTVGIKLFNAGTVNITDADLEMWTERGLLFTETWSGLMLPGESFIYVFNGKPNVAMNAEDVGDAFICIEGLGFNASGLAESYLDNNKTCKNVEGENVILMPIFPNPVIETMTLQVIVGAESEFTINLYDSRGREIQTIVPTQTLPVGLYSFVVDVQNISNGTYFVRMINGENERMEKIVISK